MARVPAPLNPFAVKAAEEAFRRAHPELKGRELAAGPEDAPLRAEWLDLYRKQNGKVLARVPASGGGPKAGNPCAALPRGLIEVYVYLPKSKPDDFHGHVGLVVQQADRSYVRYSMQAVNPNLHGWDLVQYMVWWQQSEVRTQRFEAGTPPGRFGGAGSKAIRIPTRRGDQIQSAVNEYRKDKSSYHVLTNNCADFVNDCLNAADDVSVWDHPVPKAYFQGLTRQFLDCSR